MYICTYIRDGLKLVAGKKLVSAAIHLVDGKVGWAKPTQLSGGFTEWVETSSHKHVFRHR